MQIRPIRRPSRRTRGDREALGERALGHQRMISSTFSSRWSRRMRSDAGRSRAVGGLAPQRGLASIDPVLPG